MKKRIILLLITYLFWILFFVVQKPVFMLWQHNMLGDIHWHDWLLVPWHGLPLDMSVAAYIAMAFGVLLCASVWMQNKISLCISDILTSLVLFVGLWVMLGDNGCFPHWGYHLDSSAFLLFTSPKEALANAEWWVWVGGVVGFCVLFALWWWLYRRVLKQRMETLIQEVSIGARVEQTVVLLLLTALLFLPLRGSVTVSTMNTGRVYYSDNPMLNMAAVNPLFNLIETLSSPAFNTEKYTYMSTQEAENIVNELYVSDSADTVQLFTTTRPNIVLFILESFSANAWDVMPNVQRLANEGVWLSNVYASSYRTDRGVVAVLSGFPGQPTSSLMLYPHKSQQLPQLGRDLKQQGYQLHFWYGGDEDFTSMRSYLVSGGFDNRVCDRDFPVSERMTKWGVPDHLLFERASMDIAHRDTSKTPFFDCILSLSSHEPFDVPMQRHEHPFLNAIAYTDSCIGAFADSLRATALWDNTVLVMVADHGFPYPDGISRFDTLRYKIPIVFAGGAVRQSMKINTLCSQIDLVPTLLAQLDIDHSAYRFGKNIFNTDQPHFAYYSFNDGFALLTDSGTVVVDAVVDKPILVRNPNAHHEKQAHALTQCIMEAISEL